METLAGQWWQNVDLWAIVVSAVVAVVLGWLSAWATLRAANPKRRFNWWVGADTPLIASRHGNSGAITVTAADTRLTEPRIVEFAVANTGRRDITASMFHDGEPLVFDLGGSIITLLGAESHPEGSRNPELNFPGGDLATFELLPSHIAQGQISMFTFLVDGNDGPPRCLRRPLVDVRVVADEPRAAMNSATDATIDMVLDAFGTRRQRQQLRPLRPPHRP